MPAWLTVIGIGDDGLDGLAVAARRRLDAAEVVVGGARHLAMVDAGGGAPGAERLGWEGGVDRLADAIRRHRGRRVVVLASGDPMWFGAGASLARRFPADAMAVLPHPGAFSLAAARLGWSLADVEALTVHGAGDDRAITILNRHVQPGARLLVLSRDGTTPAGAAALLRDRGFGPSRMIVLEHLGGADEDRIEATAADWQRPRVRDLNTLAVECRPGGDARLLPPVPGLPDDAFRHDGKMTKREARAAAVAALAPLPGQTLWDVGAGAGSVAIEWLRAAPRHRVAAAAGGGERAARAFAIDADADRCRLIAANAAALGVPELVVVHGRAPAALAGLPPPDAVFIGGGLSQPGVVEACWQALAAGGRLVAHAVTLEGGARLFALHQETAGDLVRLAIARAGPVGPFTAFRAAMEVTQLTATKPAVVPPRATP
jgi:precorrin-6Y C5,15-methyltransferase (decarboxylating)